MRALKHALLAALGGTLMVASAAAAQSQDEIAATIQDAAARHGVSGDRLVALARCESRLSVTAVGRAGERGLFQLHPQGLLRDFYAQGFSDYGSAYEQAEYTAGAIARGLAGHWTCWRRT